MAAKLKLQPRFFWNALVWKTTLLSGSYLEKNVNTSTFFVRNIFFSVYSMEKLRAS